MTTENKQLQKAEPSQLGFVDRMLGAIETFEKAKEFGMYIIKAGFAPKHYKDSPESIILAIDSGKKLGLDWFQSLQEQFVVNGTPGFKAMCLKGLVMASGRCKRWDEKFEGDITAGTRKHIITVRSDTMGEDYIREFSIDDAKRAGLWGKNVYNTYPDNMLEARNTANVCNKIFPDVTKGFKAVEELIDTPFETITTEGIVVKENVPSKGNAITDAAAKALNKPEAMPIPTEVPAQPVTTGTNGNLNEVITDVEFEEVPKEENTTHIYTEEELKALKPADLIALANKVTGLDLQAVIFDKDKSKRTVVNLRKIIFAKQEGKLPEHLLEVYGIKHTAEELPMDEAENMALTPDDLKPEAKTTQPLPFSDIAEGEERPFNELMQIDDLREKANITEEQIMAYVKEKGLAFTDMEQFFKFGSTEDIKTALNIQS